MKKDSPKVSVCVVVYNHEDYLRECLDSLVSQICNFDFEVIVSDDASTDASASVIEEYAGRYPHLITPIFNANNIGAIANYFLVHGEARGDYICHMDGDDMALPGKLQSQADFLDANEDVTICWHRMSMFNENGVELQHPDPAAEHLGVRVTRKDLVLYGPFGPHSSTMYRRDRFSRKYENFAGIDWLFSIELIGEGYGYMLHDVLGRYRLHSGGMSAGALANEKNREWLCSCQLRVLKEYPQYSSVLALRSLILFLLDSMKCRRFGLKSLNVFLKCKSFPDFRQLPRLVRFYNSSKLPNDFQ